MVTRYALPPDQENRVATDLGGRHEARSTDETGRAGIGFSSESIEIALQPSESGWRATIRYRRPDLQDLVSGRSPTVARDRLGLVHSICSYAHETAFTRALEAIGGSARESRARRAARELRLMIEAAAAHGRRAALEQAPFCDREPRLSDLRALMESVAAANRAVGMAGPDDAIAPDKATLADALRTLLESLRAVLKNTPSAPPAALLVRLPAAFQSPVVEGWRRPWAFATVFGYRTAGLVEHLGAEPALRPMAPVDGMRFGSSTTSRGQLTYQVATSAGRILACRTSTPTERLTAPQGPLCAMLARMPGDGDVLALARLVVLATDPCAPTSIALGHGARA